MIVPVMIFGMQWTAARSSGSWVGNDLKRLRVDLPKQSAGIWTIRPGGCRYKSGIGGIGSASSRQPPSEEIAMPKIVVLGANGQLGRELVQGIWPCPADIVPLGRASVDLTI